MRTGFAIAVHYLEHQTSNLFVYIQEKTRMEQEELQRARSVS